MLAAPTKGQQQEQSLPQGSLQFSQKLTMLPPPNYRRCYGSNAQYSLKSTEEGFASGSHVCFPHHLGKYIKVAEVSTRIFTSLFFGLSLLQGHLEGLTRKSWYNSFHLGSETGNFLLLNSMPHQGVVPICRKQMGFEQ